MEILSFYKISKFFEGELKLLERGEIALKSSHLQSFFYEPSSATISGQVHASMKEKLYNVQVSSVCMCACFV